MSVEKQLSQSSSQERVKRPLARQFAFASVREAAKATQKRIGLDWQNGGPFRNYPKRDT